MKVAVIANELQKKELTALKPASENEVLWLDEIKTVEGIDCYIDLLFTPAAERIPLLKKLNAATVIINAVTNTLDNLPENFIRINGWPGFLNGALIEAAGKDDEAKKNCETAFSYFNKTVEWVPDIPGFITARVLSMIINEAWFALDEKVSNKEAIDTAMKLGTNYPFGPFEWGEKIGLKNIHDLLSELAKTTSRYEPSPLLKKRSISIMALILNIDTALESASVCLAKDGEPLHMMSNENQKDHSSWLHIAIKEIFEKSGYAINQLEAVAVSIGPGSYTGLRVGLASAKGICYALNIPLITISTLKLIAFASKKDAENVDFICPMIDARRMEVFTSLYNNLLNEQEPPQAMILDENSYAELLKNKKILFCGSGSKKLQKIIQSTNSRFNLTDYDASHLNQISSAHFKTGEFSPLAYTEPLYIKEFYTGSTRLS